MSEHHPDHQFMGLDTIEILESPRELPGMKFWTDDPATADEYTAKLKEDPSCKKVGEYNGWPIFSSSNFYFSEVDGKISFMVRWEKHAFPGNRGDYVVQIALWRSRLGGQEGITKYVFWNFIFQLTHAVMTDASQTKMGKAFWQTRASEVLRKIGAPSGVSIYLVNLREFTAKKLDDPGDYSGAIAVAYGRTDFHKDLRMLITDHGLHGLTLVEEGCRFTGLELP